MRQVYVEGRPLALPAPLADLCHVGTVATHRLTALLACPPRFSRRKLVRCAPLVGRAATLRGNLALALIIHAGKATATIRPPT
jgi:hypothetical protein